MGFAIKHTGDFQKLRNFVAAMTGDDIYEALESYGRQGVNALANATPIDSGITAASWSYHVDRSMGQSSITWSNSEMAGGVPVVILLSYGHATGNGGYVQGRNFINPAIAGTFDQIAEGVWKAVVSA